MKTSTKRILSIALAGLFFIGVLVVYTSLIRPELEKVNEKRALFISKETVFNNQRNAVTQVEKLLGEFKNLTELQETVSLALPTSANVPDVLGQIQSIAKLAGVNINSFTIKPLAFTPSKVPLVKRLGSLEFNITVGGAYERLRNFIQSLETNVRVMNVMSWRLTPTLNAEDMNLNLQVVVYYQEG
ncbi:MAG TPA: type 4a pilus biogenesis protein PilO [Candidatus Paceibacterota bacterium]|nr:type 4a pilus biogenesis protein PilO [Candidatus Paceibacterota bacterium]